MDGWSEAVIKAMFDRGFADPYQLVAGLLYGLREQHRQSVWAARGDDYRDGLDAYTGEHATTVAESVRNLLRAFGTANLSGAGTAREAGEVMKSNHQDWVGRGQAALADLLDYYVPVWSAEGVEARELAGLTKDRGDLPDTGRRRPLVDDGGPAPEVN